LRISFCEITTQRTFAKALELYALELDI